VVWESGGRQEQRCVLLLKMGREQEGKRGGGHECHDISRGQLLGASYHVDNMAIGSQLAADGA
jgi:hypothetical protein